MHRGSTLLLSALALVVAAAVVWSLTHTWDDGASTTSRIDREDEADTGAPRLRAGVPPSSARAVGDTTGGVVEGRVQAGLGGCIATVHIRRSGQEPGSGRIRLEDPPIRPPLDRTRSAADGTFRFDVLEAGPYLVDAADDRGRRARATVVVPHDRSRRYIRLTLVDGGLSLTGRVLHASGAPFRGFVGVVVDWWLLGMWSEGDLVATDGEGRFELTGLLPGTVSLVALAPGVLRHQTPGFRLPHPGPYELVVDEALRDIEAIVVKQSDGAPIAGAVVHASSQRQAARLTTRATTDARGRCRLQGFATERIGVTATAPGFADASGRAKNDEDEVRLTMKATGKLAGLVVASGTQTPVEGAAVHLRGQGSEHVLVTGADGRFTSGDLSPGSWLATVLGGGWCAVDFVDLRKRDVNARVPAGGQAEVRIEVEPAGVAIGRVVDHEGRPVADVWVEALLEMRSYGSAARALNLAPARTADDGAFRLECLAPEQMHRLAASTATMRLVYTEPFRAVSGEAWRGDLRLPSPRSLKVTVQGPGAGAEVLVRYARPDAYEWDTERVLTSRDGTALFDPLPHGELRLEVCAPGFASHCASIPPRSTGCIERTVRLLEGHVLSGHVVNQDGTPVVDLWTVAMFGEKRAESFTDDAGAFRFEDLCAGLWTIKVFADGEDVAAMTQAQAGREDVRLTVNRNLAPPLLVHVLDPDGQPVPRFESEAHGEGFQADGRHTDGRLELAAGHASVWIEIREPRTAGGEPLDYGPALVGPLEGTETEIQVRLEKGRHVAGVVHDADGKGIANVVVRARALDCVIRMGWGARSEHLTTRTDEAGRFMLTGLAGGRHWVDVRVPARFATAEPRVVEGDCVDLEFRLRAAAETALAVVDGKGRPVVGAHVRVRGILRHSVASGVTDAQGVVPLSRLHEDERYALEITPPEDRADTCRLVIEDWRPGPGPVGLPEGQPIAGRVVDASGTPVHRASVIARHHRERALDAVETKSDGTFLVRSFPPGSVDLVAQLHEEPYGQSPVVRVMAGADDAVLVIGAGRELVLRVEDPPSALAGRAVWLVHDTMHEGGLHANFDGNGVLRVEVDPAATYATRVFLEKAGLVAWREGIAGNAGDVLLTLEPARTIRGRVVTPADAESASVSVEERGVLCRTVVAADGTFELRGLPQGTWTVNAYARTPRKELRAKVRAEAGKQVEITLR